MFSFGKRIPGKSKSGLGITPVVNDQANVDDFEKKAVLDFILSHSHGDERPYLEISILDVPLLGLLDSGASRTLVGKPGYEILLRLGLKLQKKSVTCTVANGQSCVSVGSISTPITLQGKTRVIEILVLPELTHKLILGVDFWKSMEIVPDLRQNVWHFAENDELPKICSIQEYSSLTEDQEKQLNELVQEKLALMGNGLGCCKVAEHVIELLPGTKPVKQRYYPVCPYKQKIINDALDEMLELGVVEPSKSPWSSPVCLVKKKDNSYRFCVDLRVLNKVTKKDSYPLPYISAILDNLRNARYISSIDIKSAFWTVPLSRESKELTAFTVPGRGLFQFTRMPFGLTNAPATWQRIIDSVLGDLGLQDKVMIYLDDCIIISDSFDEHIRILGLVFDRLREAGLVLAMDKCKFCLPQLKYLGFIVDRDGLRPDPEKVEAIINIPPPRNIHEIRRFMGTASWYRRFVPNFSSIMAPLTNLIKKNVKWAWTSECEQTFRKIKECLVTAPVLSCPDFDRTFTLQTDASSFGVGAVLTQEFEQGEKVICYLSRSLTRQEQKLTVTEKECLAVIWSVEKLRHYLEHTHFKVITDHHSLLWLHNLKDPQGRLARWALRLQHYDFELIHRKGKEHIVPDFLSRSVPVLVDSIDAIDETSFGNTSDRWYLDMFERLEQDPKKFPCWRAENNLLYKYVKNDLPHPSTNCWKLVVPKDKRKEVLKRCHDLPTAGHVGVYKTFWKLHDRFYWPKMRSDVSSYVRSCKACAQNKVEQKQPAGLMGNRPSITEPFQAMSLDFIGPLPRSKRGNSFALVISDYFSKYVLIYPCRAANAKALVKNVEEGVFLTYGAPQYLMCDNGSQMKSKEFQSLCQKYGVKIFFTASYNPRADPAERPNRVIKTMLKTYVNQNDHRTWDENLASIACAIRTSRHETTGYTPYFVTFGREHRLYGCDFSTNMPSVKVTIEDFMSKKLETLKKVYEDVQKRILASRERNRHHYNLRRRPAYQFSVGQEVWRKNKSLSDAANHYSAKLAPEYLGPFKIKRKTGSCTYELEDLCGQSKGVWHVENLKPVIP